MKQVLPKRKKNRLENHDYCSSGAYFITICTQNKRKIFWEEFPHYPVGEDIILPQNHIRLSQYGKIAEDAIKSIPTHYYPYIELSQYVIMPNHIHLILSIPYVDGRIISSPTSVLSAVGQMKRHVSKTIGVPIWQKSFHDHIIRDRSDYDKISQYIYENPINWQHDCFYVETECL